MFPSSNSTNQDGGLEDRLRGLILNNHPDANTNPASAQSVNLPPHMLSATPAQQQEYLTKANARSDLETASSGQATIPGRKRLNQAQRRQMNSPISIPIDPRVNQSPQTGREFTRHQQPSWPPQHNGYQTPNNQRYQQQQQQIPPQFQNSSAQPYVQHPFQHPRQYPGHQHQSRPDGPDGRLFYGTPGQVRNTYQSAENVAGQGPGYGARPSPQNRQLYQLGPYGDQNRGPPRNHNLNDISTQGSYLEALVEDVIPTVGICEAEIIEKENFRAVVEKACRDAITRPEKEVGNQNFNPLTVQLKCFGSMSSGFATKASDMDLALLSPQSKPSPESQDSQIPRLLERVLLDLGYGARLLTKTRVPIIKLCEKPTEKLKADLLAERLKWESGFDAENDEEDEDNIKGEIATEEPELTKSQVSKSAEGQESRELSIDTKTSRTGSQESAHAEDLSQEKSERDSEKKVTLKQKDGQSLPDYYSSAKRLLRKLGGRDVSDRAEELTSDEFKILNDVCRAFVAGLSSKELSNKLCRYESISSLFDPSKPPSRRPLIIIWNQIEGERLAMAWDSRPLTEPDDKREFECQGIVDAWQALLAKTEDYTNSQHDNREIYRASERLKKICSLQLMFLEQMPTEEPVQYYGRAQMILDNLKQRHTEAGGDYVTPIVIAHYISGVCNAQIKQILQNSPCGAGSLQAIALSHRILQLAFDYEHALKVGAFDKADITDVEKYVGFLRGRVVAKPDTQAETEAILISKMRNLPDPTQLSPNKPRDRYKDHLEFPKTNIGIQCDINFSAHLAIHNTLLLRCYSHCDPRVKLLILFVKNWAKVRGINTPYRGTLSSYGYVLMVLHYLVNIAQPFVCPNLQIFRREPPPYLSPSEIEAQSVCQGRDVRFWRNETEIKSLADRKMLNHNHDSLGVLLRGFFEYFAVNMPMTTYSCRSFDWGREVLSLRTHGGLLTKVEKGWIGARTTIETRTTAAPRTPSNAPANINKPNAQLDTSSEPTETNPKPAKVTNKKVEEVKEIRHRYLFAIEDPFELDHNVARTVTHGGIVAIRDEFRRAWRIIKNVGREQKEELLDPVLGPAERKSSWEELMDLLHGPVRE